MAKRVGTENPSRDAQIMPEKDLLSLLKAIRSTKSKMAEERGALGNRIARAVADKNYHVGAGNVAAKIEKWLANDDVGKAIAFVQSLDAYIDYLGVRSMNLFSGEPSAEEEEIETDNVRHLRRREQRPSAEGPEVA
jgi:hypothetical protein